VSPVNVSGHTTNRLHLGTDAASEHLCHHPRCRVAVPPKMLACPPHWFMLPRHLRAAIWREYQPGQEVTKTPSRAYLEAAAACRRFWEGGAAA
jgi:hypothetical protein